MRCGVCSQAGVTSTVHEISRTSTLMGVSRYFDEAGNEHVHDPNATSTEYHCSRGHRFGVTSWRACWCGHGEREREIRILAAR